EPAAIPKCANRAYIQSVRITTLAEYGVICALHLARRTADGPVTGREIAETERLPGDYVEQILLRLRRAGIVRSTRGAHGGYTLAKEPANISIRDVIEASETTTFDLHCISHPVGEERCSTAHTCSIRPVWLLLQQKIDEVLDGVHLADLLPDESEVRTRVGLTRSAEHGESRSLPVLGS
ncbi:MAG TPA: Rrf2 family transcriptional regulator, partial [Gemmatimonadaceae bacterium]